MCIIFLLFIIAVADAQDYFNRDSLWTELKKSNPDTNRVWLYIQLGQQYENNNPDSAIWLYEQALKLSDELDYTRGIISYYTNVTYVYNLQGRYDTALVLNQEAVEIARAFGDAERLAACLGNVGASYMHLDDHEKSINFFLEAAQLYERLQHKHKLSSLYSNLCIVYRYIGQYEKAVAYGERSLALAREIKNPYAIVSALVNLATSYSSANQLRKAVTALEEAVQLSGQTNNEYALLIALLNLSDAHMRLSDFGPMKAYCTQGLELALKLDDRESVTVALRGLAIYHFSQDLLVDAERYAREALEAARHNGLQEHIGKAYQVLSEIALLKRDFKAHNTYQFKSDSVNKVLFNESIAKNIQDLEVKYETEQKQQRILQLQQEAEIKDLSIRQNRMFIIILMGSLILLLAIGYLIRRTYRQRKILLEKENQMQQVKIAQLESEKLLTASEAVIKVQEEERGRLAKDLHDGLGGLLSGVKFSLINMKTNVVLDAEHALMFERSLDMLDHSIAELRRVAHNMMPEVLVKFGLQEAVKSYCESIRQAGIFQIDFQAVGEKGRLPSGTEIIVYRIVQELLSNAARHANATKALVQLAHQENEFSITVEDNGTGFDVRQLDNATGAGWKNIRSRVEYLKGKLDVSSGAPHGTSVHITIPFK